MKSKIILLMLITIIIGICIPMDGKNDNPHLELYAYLNDTLSRWFFNEINKKITLVDFGCGDATLTNYIQKSFHNACVIGLDVDLVQLKKNEEAYPEITFMPLINDTMPLADCSADMVYSVNVFHHIKEQDRKKYAHELVRLLKPGGVLVIFEANPYNWSARKTFYEEHDKEIEMIYLSSLQNFFKFGSNSTNYVYLYPNLSNTWEPFLRYIPCGSLYAVIVTKNQ